MAPLATATFHIQRWTETEESRPKLFYLFFIQWKKNHASLSCTYIRYFLRIDPQRVNNVNHYIFTENLFIYNQTLSESSPLIFKSQIHDKRKWISHKKNHWYYRKVKGTINTLCFEDLHIVYIFVLDSDKTHERKVQIHFRIKFFIIWLSIFPLQIIYSNF